MKTFLTKLTVLLVGLVQLITPCELSATPKNTIAAAELSGLFHTSASIDNRGKHTFGVYYELFEKAISEAELWNEYELRVLPMKRAKAGFLKKQYACYIPGLDTFNDPSKVLSIDNLLVSAPFNKAVVRLASRDKSLVVSQLEDVTEQQSISIVLGVPVNSAMQSLLDRTKLIFRLKSELNSIEMLQAGRVDHALLFYPDVIFAYQQLGLTQHFPYDQNFTPLIIEETIICHPEHQAAFDKIQQKLLRYEQDGSLKTILHDYYMKDSPLTDESPSAPLEP